MTLLERKKFPPAPQARAGQRNLSLLGIFGVEAMSKIMIVDDDFAIKLELEEMLTARGYDILVQCIS